MPIPTLKAHGARGSWFAELDGASVPCVHEYWTKKMVYDDPGCQPDHPKWVPFLAALEDGKRAILTLDKTSDGGKSFDRQSYIALFRIDDIQIADGHLRFRFVERLANVR
jgi:hypothetical protein